MGEFVPARPPCSVGEYQAAQWMAARLRRVGLHPSIETLRAPTSPTWTPLLRAVLRVWAAAFLAAGWENVALALAAISILGGVRIFGDLVRYVPAVGSVTHNVVAVRRGSSRGSVPIVVVAHLDTHPTAQSPPSSVQSWIASPSAWLALAAALRGQVAFSASLWHIIAAVVAIEGMLQIIWFARRELQTPDRLPDDNTSGVQALARVSELLSGRRPHHDTWLVATGAGTAGGRGMIAFLKSRPDLRGKAWVVEIDALGSGEVVAAPFSSRFPHPGTPAALVRAVEAAARRTGDPMKVRKQRRFHSDAKAALRMRTPGISITRGLHPPASEPGRPDPANAERAALLAASLARHE